MKGHRIARYFAITAAVTFVAYVLRVFVNMQVARQGADALASIQTYFPIIVNLLAAIIAAVLNRKYTFRSNLAWGIAIPVVVLLEMLFDILTGRLWQPVMQSVLAQTSSAAIGQVLQTAAYAFNLTQFALWALLSYLFQRFVLYRGSLDTNLATNEEGAYPHE